MNDVALKVEGTEIEIREQQSQEMEIYKPSHALSPERISFLWGLAEKIGSSSLVPKTLKTKGSGNNEEALPPEQVLANVFFVVEQADRWNISPFALMPCASVVHGRLGFEGKVIDAVLEGVYGIKLKYDWSGDGENMKIVVSGADRHGVIETIEGSVQEWKTTGNGSPWRPATYKKMLAYRGAREWARVHKSVAMLGIVSDDELHEAEMERRAQQAEDVARPKLDRFRAPAGGADAADINRQLSDAGGQQTASGRDGATAETDRRPDEGANRINGDDSSGKTPSSAQPKGQTGETSGGGENSSRESGELDLGTKQPTDAEMLRAFSDHLLTVKDGGMKALRPAASDWRKVNDGWPADTKSPAAEKINTIYAVHSKRLAGEIDEAACKAQVEGIIAAQ